MAHADDRAGQSEHGHRPLQRLRADAGAGISPMVSPNEIVQRVRRSCFRRSWQAPGASADSRDARSRPVRRRRFARDGEQLGRALQNLLSTRSTPCRRAATSRSGRAARTASSASRFRHRPGPDRRRAPAPVHAVLHDQAARHRPRPGDRAVGRRRPRRQDLGGERARARRRRSTSSCQRVGQPNGANDMIRILIVDDDAATLASLSRAFRLAGYEAVVCDNAARADRAAAQRALRPRLLRRRDAGQGRPVDARGSARYRRRRRRS